jgi:threonine synthase
MPGASCRTPIWPTKFSPSSSTDIPPADLKAIVGKTYTADVYRHTRNGGNAAQITPLTKLEDGLYTQELSNGPTLAFKDMAMQLLGNLFEYVLDKRGESINILGATSGDTGSAAEYAMRGKHNVKVFMLSPDGKMSAFQRAQMYSLQDPNIFNIAVTGLFDDAQDIVKAVSNDAAFKAKYKIGAVNSINWARVAAQIVYYFKGYFLATKSNDEQVAFCRAVWQLRQHLRRPHRAPDGLAGGQADAGYQRERRARRVLPHRRLSPA